MVITAIRPLARGMLRQCCCAAYRYNQSNEQRRPGDHVGPSVGLITGSWATNRGTAHQQSLHLSRLLMRVAYGRSATQSGGSSRADKAEISPNRRIACEPALTSEKVEMSAARRRAPCQSAVARLLASGN